MSESGKVRCISSKQIRPRDVRSSHAKSCLQAAGAPVDVRSARGQPLRRIRLHGGRYLAAATADSLLLGDLRDANGTTDQSPRAAGRVIEVPWRGSGQRGIRFNCEHPRVRCPPSGGCCSKKLLMLLPNTFAGVALAGS